MLTLATGSADVATANKRMPAHRTIDTFHGDFHRA